MGKVLLKLPEKARPLAAGFEISWHKDGDVLMINLNPGENLWPVVLAGKREDLVDYLYTLMQLVRAWGGKADREIMPAPPAPPVVAEETVEELPPADPDSRPRVTAFGLRNKTPEAQLELMIEYFNSAPPHLRNTELITELQRRYKAITDRHYKPRKVDELSQAVAKLLPYRAELLDENGQPKHGAKTQVASIMKFKQTGGGFARKIDAYLAALAEAA